MGKANCFSLAADSRRQKHSLPNEQGSYMSTASLLFIFIVLVLSLYTRSFHYMRFETLKGVLKSCFVYGNVSIEVVGIL